MSDDDVEDLDRLFVVAGKMYYTALIVAVIFFGFVK